MKNQTYEDKLEEAFDDYLDDRMSKYELFKKISEIKIENLKNIKDVYLKVPNLFQFKWLLFCVVMYFICVFISMSFLKNEVWFFVYFIFFLYVYAKGVDRKILDRDLRYLSNSIDNCEEYIEKLKERIKYIEDELLDFMDGAKEKAIIEDYFKLKKYAEYVKFQLKILESQPTLQNELDKLKNSFKFKPSHKTIDFYFSGIEKQIKNEMGFSDKMKSIIENEETLWFNKDSYKFYNYFYKEREED